MDGLNGVRLCVCTFVCMCDGVWSLVSAADVSLSLSFILSRVAFCAVNVCVCVCAFVVVFVGEQGRIEKNIISHIQSLTALLCTTYFSAFFYFSLFCVFLLSLQFLCTAFQNTSHKNPTQTYSHSLFSVALLLVCVCVCFFFLLLLFRHYFLSTLCRFFKCALVREKKI